MKAVIPAAGEGKRFNKDSTYMHKCLVPINGKALLLYTLEKGFILILLFSTIISSIGLANTYLMSQILDVLSQGATKHMVVNFIIIFIIVQSVKALVTYIFQYIVMKYNMKISNSLVKMIVNRLHGVKILSVKKYDSVYLAERLDSDTMLITNFVISSLPSICMNIIILLLVFNLVVLIELKYGIILACICGLYILLYLLFKNGLYIKMLNYRNAKSRYLQSINEQIAFIDYVQIHVIYRAFLKRLEKYYDVFYKKGILLQKNSNLYVLVQSVIYLVGFSLVIYFAGTDLANGRITVGQFTIIFTYMGIALSNTNLILTFGQTYQNTKTSYNRIKELYQLELREDGLLKKETVNFIEAKDISYIFENGNGLNKISADFQKGKRYLICGSNGAGKTTFINILIRQYKSLSGDIFIDNINIKKINYEQLRLNCFSVMNQEQKFPSVSVVEYINLSNNTEYSTREIIDRLIMKDMYNIAMDIHEVLEKETQNINMLSGGEKQKVELVKTILKDADVYFFDEPTAHLDQESRDEYYQYLKKQKDKIIVVVSHNSQERQYFDVIYEV